MFDNLSEKLGGVLDRLTRRGALTEAEVDGALREVRRTMLEADVALDVARAFRRRREETDGRRRGDEVGQSRPDGREDRARPVDRDTRRRQSGHRSQCRAAGCHHDGRPARLRQNHDHRQGREAPHRPATPESADGLARRAPSGGDGTTRRARPRDADRHPAGGRRPDATTDRPTRHRSCQTRRLRRGDARHRRTHHARRRHDERGDRGQARGQSARSAFGRRRAHGSGRGQSRPFVR